MKAACLLVAVLGAYAQDISVDENVLFSDSSQNLGASAQPALDTAAKPGSEKKSLGFSGTVLTALQSGVTRSYFSTPDVKQSTFGAQAVGDAALDARLLRGFKAYADLEWSYNAAAAPSTGVDSGAAWRVPEMFIDANVSHRVYFRLGKQVLQWGRGYFFNPTDLVNVERKSFFQRIGNREGVYGLKAHVPFGTSVNLYGFVDMQQAHRPDSLSGAGKIEWLWGGTEMAVMAWDGGHRDPVYGADFSSRVLGFDVTGEAALYSRFHSTSVSFLGSIPVLETREREWAPRAALGLGRSFAVSGIPERLTTVAEYYFNQPGDGRARFPMPAGFSLPGISAATTLSLLSQSGFYEPNSYSRNYAAFFATFARFIRSDMTLTFNAMENLDQQCALLSGGISYLDLNDFSLSFFLNGFAGPDRTEYTFSEQALQAQFIATVAF